MLLEHKETLSEFDEESYDYKKYEKNKPEIKDNLIL